MRRWRALLSTAMTVVLALSGNVQADPSHGEASGRTEAGRRSAEGALNRRVVDFIVGQFHWENEHVVQRHADLLPKALAGALNNEKVDEIPAAALVADLFGTVNETQLKALLVKAKDELKALDEKPEAERTPADKELAEFYRRLLWAGRETKLGLPDFEMLDDVAKPEPKYPAFAEAFSKAFDRVLDSRREFHELVDKINKTSDAGERQALQKQLGDRFASVTKFLDGQVATSEKDDVGKKVAESVAQAIAQKNAQGHAIDLVGPANQPLRLELGNEPSKFVETLREARRDFPPLADGGLGRTRLAPEPHRGRVTTFRKGGGSEIVDNPSENRRVEFDEKMKKLVDDAGCTGCHDPESKPPVFTADNGLLPSVSPKRFLQVVEGCGVKPNMTRLAREFREHLAKGENAAEKAALVAWAEANGFEIDLGTGDRAADFCNRWNGDGPKKR